MDFSQTPTPEVNTIPTQKMASSDGVERTLKTIAHSFIIGAFGLLPLLFLPVAYAPFDYTKTLFVVLAALIALIFFSLSVLRSGALSVVSWRSLVAFWMVVLTAGVSSLLSGDTQDSLISDTFAVHSTFFIGLMALLVTMVTLFGQSKSFIMRIYIALAGSGLVLGLFQFLRVLFGPEFLSFGLFTTNTSTLLGGWNDLALFFGLTILLSMVALEQLPLTKWGRVLFSVVVGVSLIMLSVVNFFAVWLVLALVSLMVLMYGLTKDRFAVKQLSAFAAKPATALSSVIVSAVVFIMALIFVIGGSAVGGMISDVTDISYIEVRPSLSATIDIAGSVYKENTLVGVGPNRFIDAWRLYKDRSLNETIFWATDFTTGSGYLLTQFVTNGLLGMIAWFVFLGAFLYVGVRMLFKPTTTDRFWYFIGTSSFVAATYLWGMSLVYTPGAAMMLLTALFTGITFAAASVLLKSKVYVWSIEENRRAGFALIAVVMLVIVGSASSLYYVGRHYSAIYMFSGAVSGLDGSMTLDAVEQKIASSFTIVQSDRYARQIALYELGKLNSLLAVTDPSEEEQVEFQNATANAVQAAEQAVLIDPTEPMNNSTLGAVYSVLAAAGVEGGADRASQAFQNARLYDPVNPSYALLEAQLASRIGNLDEARTKVEEAVALKQNYTDALFFLTQLDVADGKVEEAIGTTQTIIRLEPNNPARYYQLGVLYSSNKKLDEAIAAFEQAVVLDQNYANARYFLGLAYIEKGETDKAVEQLEVVASLNPDNTDLQQMITALKSGNTFATPSAETTVPETVEDPVENDGTAVTTTEAPRTSLITPVNPIETSE